MTAYLGTAAVGDSADYTVISRVEQLVGCGDTLIAVGTVSHRYAGGFGTVRSVETVRLAQAEREELIQRLSDHRFSDLATALNSTHDR
jgi:adenylate kinase